MPHIIHYDQNAFVKGRTIFDATRAISNMMDFTKARDYKGTCIMTAIDSEKAFDSVNWNFLSKSLESFCFGESFRAWIEMFYNNISSSVTNNGFSTPSFNGRIQNMDRGPWTNPWTWSMDHSMDPVHGPFHGPPHGPPLIF